MLLWKAAHPTPDPCQPHRCLLERVRHGLAFQRPKMPPCITSSQLTSHHLNTATMLVCSDPFGLGMAKSLPPKSSRPTAAKKVNIGTMLLGNMFQFAMDWLKKYQRLWRNFPANVMAAILTGMAQRVVAILEKTIRFFEWEERGVDGSKMEQQYLEDHLEYLMVNSNERYTVEGTDGCSGHFRKCISPTFGKAEMDMMYLEDEGISELCIMSPSIFLNWGSSWEPSSEEENMDLEDIMSPGQPSKEQLGDCIQPQMSLGIGACFGKNLPGDTSHQEDLEDTEGDLWQRLESTPVSQEREEDQLSYEDLVMHEEDSVGNSPDFLNDDEHLEMSSDDEDETEDALNSEATTMAQGCRSSLVLSLFYSPSEDETEDGDDSEDWWNELEESEPSSVPLEDCGSGMKSSQLKDDTLHGDEGTCGSFLMNNNPFRPLCLSKTIRPLRTPTVAPPGFQKQQEITVSFYLSKSDSKPGESFNPPKQLWPKMSARVTRRSPAHQHCQPDSRKNENLFTTETSPKSQEQNQVVKKVRFSPVVKVHPLVVWDYASRSSRRGPWEEMARDRCRFSRRIAEVGGILEPCLEMEHRAQVWRRIYGVPDSFQANESTKTPSISSAAAKELRLQNQG